MKKLLLPIIGSLIIGSTITGGTVYAVKTIRHNAEVERIRTLFQNEAKSAQQLIDLVSGHLSSIKKQNQIINGELDRINTQSNSILTNAKKVYEKAVKLTTYTVKDHEEKDVTYYLAYYDVQNKQIVATVDSTTQLTGKQEVIPTTLEDLLANEKGIKVEHLVDGQLKTETLTKNRFNAKEFTTLNKVDVTQKIIEDVLKKTHQGGEKLIKFFQNKLNELTKLKEDLETIDVEDFVNLLGKLEKDFDKETWKTKNTKEKLDKIKKLLTSLKGEWDKLSGGVDHAIKELKDIVQKVEDIANRAKNDGAPSSQQPPITPPRVS